MLLAQRPLPVSRQSPYPVRSGFSASLRDHHHHHYHHHHYHHYHDTTSTSTRLRLRLRLRQHIHNNVLSTLSSHSPLLSSPLSPLLCPVPRCRITLSSASTPSRSCLSSSSVLLHPLANAHPTTLLSSLCHLNSPDSFRNQPIPSWSLIYDCRLSSPVPLIHVGRPGVILVAGRVSPPHSTQTTLVLQARWFAMRCMLFVR